MSGVYLVRREPARNMARFYRLDVQPTLFGAWTLWREWGRIGSPGRVRAEPYPTAGAAQLALAKVLKAKARRGYTTGAVRSVSGM
jgi:predicted DNA-binding WGR domain protein